METCAGRVFVYGGGIVAGFAAERENHVEVVLPLPEIKINTPTLTTWWGAGFSRVK
jgi:hypothetical protein